MSNIATRLVAILTSLRHAIAAYTAQQNRGQTITWLGTQAYRPIESPNQPPKLPSETWVLFWHRLGRMTNRFQTLFTRWQTGTLPARHHRHRERREIPTRPASPIPRLPTTPGWVNARITEAAPCAGTLDYLLQDPELPRFLAAAPQAGRLLRPLCRALGIPAPDWLKLPPRPPKPKPHLLPRPPRGEPEGGVPFPPATPDRPLPPNIRAAARAWKKYDN